MRVYSCDIHGLKHPLESLECTALGKDTSVRTLSVKHLGRKQQSRIATTHFRTFTQPPCLPPDADTNPPVCAQIHSQPGSPGYHSHPVGPNLSLSRSQWASGHHLVTSEFPTAVPLSPSSVRPQGPVQMSFSP